MIRDDNLFGAYIGAVELDSTDPDAGELKIAEAIEKNYFEGGKQMNMYDEYKSLQKEGLELRSKLDNKDIDETELDKIDKRMGEIETRSKEIKAKMDMVDTMKNKKFEEFTDISGAAGGTDKKTETRSKNDWASSLEYRQAFMEFAQTGVMPEEFRAVAMTAGNSAVIPVPTMNVIIQKLENYGNILPLVTRVNYPAGVTVPTSQLGSAAVWTTDADLASKGAAVDGKTTGTVTFSAFPLVKAVGISFVAGIQSLSAFETAIANEVPTAMGKALEQAIVAGTGTGQPTGILSATAAATVTLSKALSFKDIVAIKKAIPSQYRTGAVLLMNESTFYDFLAITDAQGQPIARVNMDINGAPTYQLFGSQVVCTDWMPDYDTAAAGKTVVAALQLEKYILNCAYNMDLVTYVEQTTRNKVYQSFALYDGKMVDTNGLVFVNKPAA